MSVWGGAGNTIVIFLAALQGVPRQLLEAVEIDGGNWWHKFRAITWPMISPVTFFNIVVGLINSFQIFTQSYVMTSGGPNNASLFYVYLMYREGFERNNMGGAAALAWVLFLIVSLLGLVLFRWSRAVGLLRRSQRMSRCPDGPAGHCSISCSRSAPLPACYPYSGWCAARS